MSGQLNNTESFNTAGYQGNHFSLIWKLKAPGNWIFLVTGSFVWCSNAVYPINDVISRTVPPCGCLFPLCFVFDLLNCKKSSGNKQKEKKREREKKKRNQILSEVDYYLHNLSFSIHRYAVQQCELFILWNNIAMPAIILTLNKANLCPGLWAKFNSICLA